MTRKKIKYIEKKLYLKEKETLIKLNQIIQEFGSSDKTIKAFITAFEINPLLFKPKMI